MGPVQTTVNRSIDLLPTTTRVLELVHDDDLAELEADLLLRLQLGLPRELSDLGMMWGDRVSRAQYLALRDAPASRPLRIRLRQPRRGRLVSARI